MVSALLLLAQETALVVFGALPGGAASVATGVSVHPEPVPASGSARRDEQTEYLVSIRRELRALLGAGNSDDARVLLSGAVAEIEGWERGRLAECEALEQLDALAKELSAIAEQWVIRRRIVDISTRELPPDDLRLFVARLQLGAIVDTNGDLARARLILESAIEDFEEVLPADHRAVLTARHNLATTVGQLGDLEAAVEQLEAVLVARQRTLPPENRQLLSTRQNLATAMRNLGDLARARAMFEPLLEIYARILPETHPQYLGARMNHAVTLEDLGDSVGALATQERLLELYERNFPPDHPNLIGLRLNLVRTRSALGDADGAIELNTQVLESYARLLPADHPDVLRARNNLGVTLGEADRLDEAREVLESVIESAARVLPEDHADAILARQALVGVLVRLGERERALDLQRLVVDAFARTVGAGNPQRGSAQGLLVTLLLQAGDEKAAEELLRTQVDGTIEGLLYASTFSPRETRGACAQKARIVDSALFAAERLRLPGLVLELVETRRHLSTLGLPSAAADHTDEQRSRRAAIRRLQSELNALVLDQPAGQGLDEWRARVGEVSFARDRLMRALRASAGESGVFLDRVETAAVGARLRPGSVAVGFLRHHRWRLDESTRRVDEEDDWLVAFVIDDEAEVTRVEIGNSEEMHARVEAWRASLALDGGRGVSVEPPAAPDSERARGRELRAALLDPVISAAGLAPGDTLHVCLDDFLSLVPLDALPLEDDGARVGDAYRVRNEVSFGRLLAPARAPVAAGGMLLVGYVDFDADAAEPDRRTRSRSAAPPTPPATGGPRGGAFGNWSELPGTRDEIVGLASLFREAAGEEAVTLARAAATKASILEHATGKRYVHFATHGWFTPETVLSFADRTESAGRGSSLRVGETVRGFAPMTLCGLCVAGANRGRGPLGDVPGLLTAEELSSFDLSGCELAVLSACETNVGYSRAGQGVLSLQAALHHAGARTAVTSLWRVPDAATMELMQIFYTRLWTDGLPKADALWAAKAAMRDEGYSVRDWAGWVLTGDPE